MGRRFAWVFVVAAVVVLAKRQARLGLLLGGVTLAVIVVGISTAQDFGRSMMFLMPVAVLGVVLAARAQPRGWPAMLAPVAAAALLLPAQQVVSDGVHPIFYLYYQLSAFDHPPAGVMPEIFELRAIRAMQEGRTGPAEADLTLAIKLAANPAGPAKQRGVLRASQGRWKEAAEDFALMARHEPKNPDAWFMCAQSALALGDAVTAQTNLQHALEIAPADWNTRPDVARFQARLQQGR
jgi:tetratricopeptide (TPR) repeat protein